MNNIEKRVLELVEAQAGIEPGSISINTKFQDLNFDSVGLVELVFSIEESFNISIPFEGVNESELKKNFHSVSSLVAHLKDLLQTNA